MVSIIDLVNNLIAEAHRLRASDIHIDPHADTVKVRMRIDGVLQDISPFSKHIQSEVITRIKVLAGLRTDEHQAPQDGRFRLMLENADPIDLRVSITPTYHGEHVVLRLLTDHGEQFTLEKLGFIDKDREKITRALQKPHGMILVTGPTGSGKTTTLYTLLKELNSRAISIITIEDPIEYAIEGVNQIQANARTGLTFANGLRSIIRQDPDIIMVGEIRDTETARLAVNTALTGHLILSTLHTNDAATTLPRLLDLGIEPYLIAATVNLVIGQRLVRKMCSACNHADGCSVCNYTGYRGRVGIYEVMSIDAALREAMLKKYPAADIHTIAASQGMQSLFEDGREKAAAGITTLTEVMRVIHE